MDYSEEFEAVWKVYPLRPNNPKKAAFKAYQARIRSGETADNLREAVIEYSKHLQRTGKIGTEYVMMAATFFGPNERYVPFIPKPEAPALSPAPKRVEPPKAPEPVVDGRQFIREIIENLSKHRGLRGFNAQ